MEFRILGPLQVVKSGRPVHPGAPKQRELLALLLIHANEVVSKDRILDELWPAGPPAGGVQTLHVHVSKLRKALGRAAPLRTKGPGYVMELGPDDFDAMLFERLWRRARSDLPTNPGRAAVELRRALALWRGPPLADFTYEPFAEAEIRRLELLRLSALEDAIDADLALGRHADVVDRLETLTADNPLQERMRGQLMTALYRLGRQAEALRVYTDLRRLLADELGIEPSPELSDLEERILLHDTSLLPAPLPDAASHELPVRLTSFVGRWREQADLRATLQEHRLVTVSGLGGVGKTSLAVEVARDAAADSPDGTWLVTLATLDDEELVIPKVAAAVGLTNRPRLDLEKQVTAHLQDRRALLILDNCEHVVGSVARLADRLLRHCPDLHIMATSRMPLGVEGEAIFTLAPLETPGAETALTQLGDMPSVRLLVDRVASRRPGFAVNQANATALGTICRWVGGIPLAIELAASRLPTISPTDLAQRLDNQFELLTTGRRTAEARQQTLEATMDWSYRLLSEDEQTVLTRAAVFRGAFSIDSAEAVTAGGRVPVDRVADVLGRIVDASLLTRESEDRGQRYRMLEPVRQYGVRLLTRSGDLNAVRHRHAKHFAESASELIDQYDAESWTALIRTGKSIIDDSREAVSWAIQHGQSALALRLAASLGSYWTVAGGTLEGFWSLRSALASAPRQPTPERLRALEHCAQFAVAIGEPADTWLDELEQWVDTASGNVLARVTSSRGVLAFARGDLDTALGFLETAYQHSQTEGEPIRVGTLLAECLTRVGRLDEADKLLDELHRRETKRAEYGNHYIAVARGMVAFCRGDLDTAEMHLEEGVKAFGRQGSSAGQMESMMYLGWVTLDREKERRTRLLVDSSLSLARTYAGALYEATSLWLLARLALYRGDLTESKAMLEAATDVAVRRREAVSMTFSLFTWADLASVEAKTELAAQLFGAADQALAEIPHIMPPTTGRRYDEAKTALRKGLGDDAFSAATAAGAQMTLRQAIDLAISTAS